MHAAVADARRSALDEERALARAELEALGAMPQAAVPGLVVLADGIRLRAYDNEAGVELLFNAEKGGLILGAYLTTEGREDDSDFAMLERTGFAVPG